MYNILSLIDKGLNDVSAIIVLYPKFMDGNACVQ